MSGLRRRRLTVRGHRVRLRVGGPVRPSRPPVVLVAGLTMSGRYLAPTARALAVHRHVVVPDLPGTGRSPHGARPLDVPALADVVHGVLTASTGPAVVLANSFGCQVAVELALRHPDAVRLLVLTSPVLAPRLRGLRAVAARFATAMRHEPARYLGIVVLDSLRAWPRKRRANLRALRAYPILERAQALRVPVVVVRGARDPLVPAPFARALARAGRGRFVEVPAPHALTYDAPRALARIVDEH